jgi:hypothetical protein
MCSAKAKELVEVVKYFRDEFDDLWQQTQMLKMEVGGTLVQTGLKLMQSRVESQPPHPKRKRRLAPKKSR